MSTLHSSYANVSLRSLCSMSDRRTIAKNEVLFLAFLNENRYTRSRMTKRLACEMGMKGAEKWIEITKSITSGNLREWTLGDTTSDLDSIYKTIALGTGHTNRKTSSIQVKKITLKCRLQKASTRTSYASATIGGLSTAIAQDYTLAENTNYVDIYLVQQGQTETAAATSGDVWTTTSMAVDLPLRNQHQIYSYRVLAHKRVDMTARDIMLQTAGIAAEYGAILQIPTHEEFVDINVDMNTIVQFKTTTTGVFDDVKTNNVILFVRKTANSSVAVESIMKIRWIDIDNQHAGTTEEGGEDTDNEKIDAGDETE